AGGQKRIPELFVKDIRIPLPPIEEQRKIAAAVEAESKVISDQIEKIREHVRTLREYRAAVITQAVTGTFKVV
ncbi:MAG: restriction endonuclease subunit S, partial [Fimbriimonadaceae bacterium]|nr:restriction endonuclease subunit S [Fimbriimonadaceae bacterium]